MIAEVENATILIKIRLIERLQDYQTVISTPGRVLFVAIKTQRHVTPKTIIAKSIVYETLGPTEVIKR